MERTFTFFATDTDTDAGADDDADPTEGEGRVLKVRLDKWLWAARFFKTRALARVAVEEKKIGYWINGQQISKLSPSREVEIGATLTIQYGRFIKMVIVKGLSTRRKSTEEAAQLFQETEASRRMRAKYTEQPFYGFSPETRNTFSHEDN